MLQSLNSSTQSGSSSNRHLKCSAEGGLLNRAASSDKSTRFRSEENTWRRLSRQLLRGLVTPSKSLQCNSGHPPVSQRTCRNVSSSHPGNTVAQEYITTYIQAYRGQVFVRDWQKCRVTGTMTYFQTTFPLGSARRDFNECAETWHQFFGCELLPPAERPSL